MEEIDKIKLIGQLFIGKVTELIGFDKAVELLKESQEAVKELEDGNKTTKVK